MGEGQFDVGLQTKYSSQYCILLPPFVVAEWGKAGMGVNTCSRPMTLEETNELLQVLFLTRLLSVGLPVVGSRCLCC